MSTQMEDEIDLNDFIPRSFDQTPPDIGNLRFPTEREIKGGRFPYAEGYQWEYKQTFSSIDKIYETVCGFLNHKGGYIVIGVTDKLEILGIRKRGKELDRFLLRIDDIYHTSLIMREGGKELSPQAIQVSLVTRDKCALLCITVRPEPGVSYQMKDGAKYIRLSASNHCINVAQFYTKKQVIGLLASYAEKQKVHQRCIIENLEDTVATMKDELTEIKDLLYKRILEDKITKEEEIQRQQRSSFCSLLCSLYI